MYIDPTSTVIPNHFVIATPMIIVIAKFSNNFIAAGNSPSNIEDGSLTLMNSLV